MATYKFSPVERHAVWTVHGEKCYLCARLLDLKTMEVDHVIPESLLNKPSTLAETKTALGLADDFGINSFENWLPICRGCNQTKSDTVFEPTLQVQLLLQTLRGRAARARELAAKVVTEQRVMKALNVLEAAAELGQLTPQTKSALLPLLFLQTRSRVNRMADEPIRLKPDFVIPAHKFSSLHRGDLLQSDQCGCFYCLTIFKPAEVTDWTDDGDTAICPHCGIDSVIGSASGYSITPPFLAVMHDHWFSVSEEQSS